MPTANVNIVAVLVAALVTFILGAFWYSPLLFARQWMQAQGYTPEKLEQMKKRGAARAYVISALCYFVMAYVMALFVSYVNSTSVVQGLWLGFLSVGDRRRLPVRLSPDHGGGALGVALSR